MEEVVLKKPGIDVNRGVRIKRHKPTGMRIYMYKDAPGTYYTAHGKEVGEDLAKQVGFPVEEYAKLKLRISRRKMAMDTIDAELAVSETAEQIVLEERNGYKLIDRHGNVDVIDDLGNRLNTIPVPKAIGLKLLDSLAGEVKKPTPTNPQALKGIRPLA